MTEDKPLFSRCRLGKPKSTASDWTLGFDSDGADMWVHKPTGGAVRACRTGGDTVLVRENGAIRWRTLASQWIRRWDLRMGLRSCSDA